jgi:hypothetical protein
MLNRHQVFEVSREGCRLLTLQSKAVGRKLRRFVERYTEGGCTGQQFAFEEHYSLTQLDALRQYAKEVAATVDMYLTETFIVGCLNIKEVVGDCVHVADADFGLVSNVYFLKVDVKTASVTQLRDMVKFIVLLSDCMHAFAASRNDTALRNCPEYIYRSYPCSITSDDKLWLVCGEDARGGSGVLEWCYDAKDAHAVLEQMNRFPERFYNLSAEKWEPHNANANKAVA